MRDACDGILRLIVCGGRNYSASTLHPSRRVIACLSVTDENTRMTEAKVVLAELRKSVDAIRDGVTELGAQNVYYERIKRGTNKLRELCEGQAGEAYIREKISDFERSTSALAALHEGNQHTKSQHVTWAIGALNTLDGLDIGKVPRL